jgi:hypothetical protein
MGALIEMTGKGVARRPVAKGTGLTLINDTLADFVEPLRIADECRRQLQQGIEQGGFYSYLGCERGLEAKFLDRAKIIHGRLLRNIAQVQAAYSALLQVVIPPWRNPLTHAQATAMLGVLFGTLSKTKADDENSAMLLASCADLFNPTNDIIGTTTGLWKPISKHPLVLALAIKQLIATSVFKPSPSELRDAMKLALSKLDALGGYSGQWLELLTKADEIIFAFDRPAWDAAYAEVNSKIPLAMQAQLFDEESYEDSEATPRWQALDDLTKRQTEEATQRIAACKTTSAKRTRKPKGG